MTIPFRVRGTVPPDSPLTAVAGRTVSLPAASLEEVIRRITELRDARVPLPLVVVAPARVSWAAVAWSATGVTVAAIFTAVWAISAGEAVAAWSAVAVILLGMLAAFLAGVRHERGLR